MNAGIHELERIERKLDDFRHSSRPEDEELPWRVQEILDCIHEKLFDPDLSVKTVRSKCGIRDNNISSHFRWEVGKTIKEYIESLRLEAACHLLEDSECGVFDVALSVGYYHPQTFYRAFDRSFDCTPAEYRRKLQRQKNGASRRGESNAEAA